jgi:hypothetical protein
MDLPRFIFRGNAVGVGGHIHAPEDLIIWVQGASSLPVIGGYSRSSVDRVSFPKYLTAARVKTQANGDFSEKDKAFRTIATSSVQKVVITDRLNAELLEANLISTHPLNGGQPSIVPTGTAIKNMRLDGFPVTVKLDLDPFIKYSTYDSLKEAYENDDAFFKRYGSRFATRPPKAKKAKVKQKSKNKTKTKREIPIIAGYVMCSIVDEIRTEHPRAKIEGNVIILEGFGRIFLGELLITSVSKRLTLLRTKLGSPVTGDIVCAEVEDNGILPL